MKNPFKNLQRWLMALSVMTFSVVAFLAMSGTVFAAAPAIVSGVYQDDNGDGRVDQIVLTFDQNIKTCTAAIADFTYVAHDITGSLITGGTVSCAPATAAAWVKITMGTLGTQNITSHTTAPHIAYTAATGVITNAADEATVNFVETNLADGAGPVVTALAISDGASNDGKIDTITATYSEALADTAIGANGFVVTSATNHGNCGAVSADPAVSTTLVATISCANVYTSVGDMNVVFTTNAGIKDALNNQAPTKTWTSASTPPITDNANPILIGVAAGTASGANTIAFKYSEGMAISGCTGAASSATCGDLTSVGTFVGLGNFVTNGNLVVPTTKNTVAVSTTTITNDTITVTLAGQTGGYVASADVAALTVPSGNIAGSAAAGVVDGAGLQVNGSGTVVEAASPLPSVSWDITRPTVTVATFADTYLNNAAFVAGGTFNTGTDGKADTVTLTASETLKTITDAAGTRNDWVTSTGATNAYGTSWVPIKAAASGTTYTINFSGLNLYYDPGTFEVINVQDAVPSFVDAAGNPLASGLTDQTYKLCYTGYSCASGTIANSAIITNSVTQPGQEGGGTDTVPPSVPTGLAATVNDSLQVVLTWTDPTASDLSNVRIYRIKNEEAAVSISVVGKGMKTYTDAAVADGDVMKYAISSLDLTGNESSKSSYVQVTVAAGAQGEAVVVTEEEEEPAVEPVVTEEEEEPAVEPITVTTETGATVTLEDVTGHWAEDEITAMAEQEIVEGDADGNFNPDDSLNRAEAAAILYRVLGLDEPTAPEEAPFTDVAIDAWYAGYVANLKSLSLVDGQTETTYAPASPINRAEFLNLAMNVYHYLTGTTTAEDQITTDAFSDLNTTAWYAPVVSEAYGLEFISGSTCGETTCFNAGDPITRAEATKILYNMFYAMLTAQTVE